MLLNFGHDLAPQRQGVGPALSAICFSEQGVAMFSSVLNSERAVLVNIEIMRAFVNLRRLLSSNVDLARKMNELGNKYDRQFPSCL